MPQLAIPSLQSASPELSTSLPAGRGIGAAREFEAYLIGSLLQDLEKTFAAVPGQDNSAGSDDYNYLGTQALARGIANQGGFGITEMILQHLPSHESTHESGDRGLQMGSSEAKAIPDLAR